MCRWDTPDLMCEYIALLLARYHHAGRYFRLPCHTVRMPLSATGTGSGPGQVAKEICPVTADVAAASKWRTVSAPCGKPRYLCAAPTV